MWLQQNWVKSLCKYVMKVSYPLQHSHTHTEQTTQPLVMHSFVTSNPLPLGYETQHRMSERERQRQRQRILKERESFLCVEEDTFHIYAVKEKRDGRK